MVTVSAACDSGTSTCDADTTIDSAIALRHEADDVSSGRERVDDEAPAGVGLAIGDRAQARGDHNARAGDGASVGIGDVSRERGGRHRRRGHDQDRESGEQKTADPGAGNEHRAPSGVSRAVR
jgi:hypothetical protein